MASEKKGTRDSFHEKGNQGEAERALLKTLIDAVPDLVYQKDLRGRYVFANRSFAEIAGLSDSKDVIGRTDREVFPREIADKLICG